MSKFRIKEIIFLGSKLEESNSEKVVLFEWYDKQPINIFYFQNGYGKSTLYQIICKILSCEKTIPAELTKINNNEYELSEISFKVELNGDIYDLLYKRRNPKSNILELTNVTEKAFGTDSFRERFEKEIYNQKRPLIYIKVDQQVQRRTTLDSLGRFNFFSDESYYHQKSKECDLADTHKDGEGKWVLFNYILGEDLDDMPQDIMQQVGTHKKFTSKVLKELQNQYDRLPINSGDNLFAEALDQQQEEIINRQREIKEQKIIKKDAEFGLSKIKELLGNTELLENYNKITDFLNKEKTFLEEFIKELEETIDKNLYSLQEDVPNLAGLLQNMSEKTRLEKRINEVEHYINFTLSAVKRYEAKSREQFYKQYENIYNPLLKKAGYIGNADLKYTTLKVALKKGDKLGDGHLRLTRLLYLVSLQFYKELYPTARTLGIGFFDAPFYGVTLTNVVNFFEALIEYYEKNQSNTQLFFFVTRITDYEDEDRLERFMKLNTKYVYNHKRNTKDNKMIGRA